MIEARQVIPYLPGPHRALGTTVTPPWPASRKASHGARNIPSTLNPATRHRKHRKHRTTPADQPQPETINAGFADSADSAPVDRQSQTPRRAGFAGFGP